MGKGDITCGLSALSIAFHLVPRDKSNNYGRSISRLLRTSGQGRVKIIGDLGKGRESKETDTVSSVFIALSHSLNAWSGAANNIKRRDAPSFG